MNTFLIYPKARILVFIITVFTISSISYAQQYTLKSNKDVVWFNNKIKEKIELQTNNDVFIVGENIYYKLLIQNLVTNVASSTSKVAYINLYNDQGLIFQHKLLLTNSIAENYYEIPKSLPSGHYKLIAFTEWMRNNENSFYVEKDIIILNPTNNLKFKEDTVSNQPNPKSSSEKIWIKLNNSSFKLRDKVGVEIGSNDTNIKLGHYTLKVIKQDDLNNLVNYNGIDSLKSKVTKIPSAKKTGDIIQLPETNINVISGKVINKNTQAPIENARLMLSILDDSAFQDFAITNIKGEFYFNLNNSFQAEKAIVQIIDSDDTETTELIIDKKEPISKNESDFKDIYVPNQLKESIRERSITAQVENAYGEVKENLKPELKVIKPFYGNHEYKFVLDDYKRFPTLGESLTEVVDHTWHERYKGKERAIYVRERENSPFFGENILSLVVLDGTYIKDHNSILDEDADKIESVSVFRDEFYFGDKVYQGAVMIKTFDQNFHESLGGNSVKVIDLIKPQLTYKYYNQSYKDEIPLERVPDYRTQLLWMPDFAFNNSNKAVSFYTSDIIGNYKIVIEGFAKNGLPVYVEKEFKVN